MKQQHIVIHGPNMPDLGKTFKAKVVHLRTIGRGTIVFGWKIYTGKDRNGKQGAKKK